MQAVAILCIITVILVTDCESSTICSNLRTCSECILINSCAWCASNTTAHCFERNGYNTCQEMVDPHSTILETSTVALEEQEQVSLKYVHLNLRVGEPQTFSFSVKAAMDFPLDIYMLMDISRSFDDDLENIKLVASDLISELRNISSDVRIGFGTFVDKETLPYTSKGQLNLDYMHDDQPSACQYASCSRPYSFEHVISLTNSSEDFNSTVQQTQISTNADEPEGTLDAMMQAIVCNYVIGWRENSRKILFVITDESVHMAGDGKVAGITKQHDGKCHTEFDPVDNKTKYTYSTEHDYPSLEQVRMALRDNGIVTVFAIPESSNRYSLFSKYISIELEGLTTKLSGNSDNIQTVLQEAYLAVVSRARLSFNVPDYIAIEQEVSCPPNKQSSSIECNNINHDVINFTLSVTLNVCTEELESEMESILITVPGYGRLLLTITAICECECEKRTKVNSSVCTYNGSLTCGTCDCNQGWTGPDCSCSTSPCKKGLNTLICSGRGKCICGECQCDMANETITDIKDPLIFGETCECSNYECERGLNNLLCSGRGACSCFNGQHSCICANSSVTGQKHAGDICQCSADHCVDPDGPMSEMCSGHGSCEECLPAGQACTCESNVFGPYCSQMVSESSDVQCNKEEVKSCIECYGEAGKDGKNIESVCSLGVCRNFTLLSSSAENSYEIPGSLSGSTVDCSFISGECLYTYFAAVTESNERVYAVEPRVCLLIPIWSIALIIFVCLLIIGFAILASVKLFVIFCDYREFKEFEKEVQNADFSGRNNPMYQNPEKAYTDVAYHDRVTKSDVDQN